MVSLHFFKFLKFYRVTRRLHQLMSLLTSQYLSLSCPLVLSYTPLTVWRWTDSFRSDSDYDLTQAHRLTLCYHGFTILANKFRILTSFLSLGHRHWQWTDSFPGILLLQTFTGTRFTCGVWCMHHVSHPSHDAMTPGPGHSAATGNWLPARNHTGI